jgi:APA family basic amino acid/polyamine antiporter
VKNTFCSKESRSPSGASIGLFTAMTIIIADMIGTGIFTTTGMVARDVESSSMLLALWAVGGLIALCGALSYARLANHMPESGGEYFYLSRMYHPLIGFLSAWTSLIAGFSAPIAAAAVAFGLYLKQIFPAVEPRSTAVLLIVAVAGIQVSGYRRGFVMHNLFTLLKFVLLIFLICSGFIADPANAQAVSGSTSFLSIFKPEHAVSLIFISFAYSGWNASTYISGDVRNARKVIPISLLLGTSIVTVLYLLLNSVYLRHNDMEAMRGGVVEVGYSTAISIFGSSGGSIIAGIIAVVLLSSVSSMIIAGSFVVQATGKDLPLFGILARKSSRGGCPLAVIVQSGVAILLVLTSSFDQILYYIGFSISIFAMLAVAGSMVLVSRERTPYALVRFIPPVIFIIFSLWSVIFSLRQYPSGVLFFLLTAASGTFLFYINQRYSRPCLVPPLTSEITDEST